MPQNSKANPSATTAPAISGDLGAEFARQRTLIVEDNPDTAEGIRRTLGAALGSPVDVATNGAQALALLEETPYSLVITDLRMPRTSGLDLLREVQARQLPATVVVMTGYGGVDEAVEAMRGGAYDFLTKPVNPDQLVLLVRRALRERALRDEVAALRSQFHDPRSFHKVLSKDPRMLEIFELIGCVSETATTVLIEGETGTGKELIARAIHQASPGRRDRPLVVVNCAALPENLLESELFGHEKGSFTSAVSQRKGRFELANGGTLFLDEVGDIPASMQVKLLRVLQEREFERVGGTEKVHIDIRVIGATNRSLQSLVKEGKFREDLFYRLNVFKIDLPPLRDRAADIPLLAAHFTEKYGRPGQPVCQIAPDAMRRILDYGWPGNVRQLENAIERAVITARNGTIEVEDLPPELASPASRKATFPIDLGRPLPEQLKEVTADFEARYLKRALKKSRGHVGRCARISGLSRRSVTSKIAQYGIDPSSYKQDA